MVLVLLGALAVLLVVRRPTRRELVSALDEVGTRLDAIDRSIGGARAGAPDPTSRIGASLDLGVVLRSTLAAARAVGDVDGGHVAVPRLDGTLETAVDGLVPAGATGADGPPDGTPFTAARYAWEVTGEGLRSGVAVPFAGGSLAVYSRTVDAFDDRSASLLRSIVERAEPAVGNALEHLRVLEEAATDVTTGFGSRRALEQALPAAIATARRHRRQLCLIQVDLDDFGMVNRLHGYEQGDALLAGFGERVRAEKRDSDQVFRNSGGADEFFLILPETGRESAKLTYKRICVAISAPYDVIGRVTISSGLAELRPDDSPQTLRERAGRELMRAKAGGKNRLCSDDGDSWVAPD